MPTKNSSPYTHLAEFYEKAGFTRFSDEIIPRIILRVQQSEWVGRRIMDMGCGVGTATIWLAQQGFRVTGVDISNAMLAKARLNAQAAEIGMMWRQQDIRALEYSDGTLDLVTALGVINYIGESSELEQVFAHAHRVLAPDKLFIFDLYTIRGLAEHWGTRNHVPFDNQLDLMIFIRSNFNYETLTNTLQYIIFHHDGMNWNRAEETHALYGYHFQVINYLLERVGFDKVTILNPDLTPINGANDGEERAIFIAHKPSA